MHPIHLAESDIRQALEGLQCPRIIKAAIFDQYRTGSLDAIIQTRIESGAAGTIPEAIKLLVAEAQEVPNENKVTLSHLQNLPANTKLRKELDEVLGKERISKGGDRSRIFGVKSHVTIPQLFAGELIKSEAQRIRLESTQLGLDFTFVPEQLPIFSESHTVPPKELKANRRIEKIRETWKYIVQHMQGDLFPTHLSAYQTLVDLMKPIFKDGLSQVLEIGKRSEQHAYLAMITILSWVPALLRYYKSEPLILFKEISMMPYNYDVSLGRIDALSVRTINGAPPTMYQQEILRKLSHEKFSSVGHLIEKLVHIFGQNLHLIIYDWKFAAGDGDNGIGKTLNIIHTDDAIREPLLKHKRQMERYNSTALLSYAMVHNHTLELEKLWETSHFSIAGEIHYFLPNIEEPVVHHINLDEYEKREVFRSQVVDNYTNAEQRSKVVSIGKNWLRRSVHIAENRTREYRVKTSEQLALDLIDTSVKGKVSQVIKDHVEHVYADELKIIERIGYDKNGHPLYRMHLDRLFQKMEGGAIDVERFSYESGGKIKCFVHHERTGSMSLDFKKDVFKCFGCGIGGKFSKESLPEHLAHVIHEVPGRTYKRINGDIEKFSVPERHKEAMVAAQRILQNQFLDSAGALYLQKTRALNPEFSQQNGAGYDDGRLIPYLIDQGFSYDEIINFGFLSFSEKISESNPLIQELLKRGLHVDELQREYEKKSAGKTTRLIGLPYSMLYNRVTYPLDIEGIITSFYGRTIHPEARILLHIKTKCHEIPQGGFNITRAVKNAIRKAQLTNSVPEIGITESPIDVDTFIQRSTLKEFGGMVGTSNTILYQILSMFPGSIIAAFDNDPSKIVEGVERGASGQRMTKKLGEELQIMGFTHPLYDFTEPFAAKHPEYKDINKYWQNEWYKHLSNPQYNPGRIDVLFHKKRIF